MGLAKGSADARAPRPTRAGGGHDARAAPPWLLDAISASPRERAVAQTEPGTPSWA